MSSSKKVKLTKEELAAELDGFEIPFILPQELREAAERSGLVIITAEASSCVLNGAIQDAKFLGRDERVETFTLCRDGFNPNWERMIETCGGKKLQAAEDALEDYFNRKRVSQELVVFRDAAGYSWRFEISVPYATFRLVIGNSEIYRGIVFSTNDF